MTKLHSNQTVTSEIERRIKILKKRSISDTFSMIRLDELESIMESLDRVWCPYHGHYVKGCEHRDKGLLTERRNG